MKKEHNEQVQLPSGYTELEYLQSTGTQYIDTGVILSEDYEIRCNFYSDYKYNYYFEYLFGCQNRRSPWAAVYIRKSNYSEVSISKYISGIRGQSFKYNQDGLHNIIQGKNGDNKYFHLDSSIQTTQDTTHQYQSLYPLFIFAMNAGGSVQEYGKYKLFDFQIDNNQLNVRNFIPSLRTSDNKPGLYDLCGSICPLTGTPFYVNAGTGEFLFN